MATERYFSTDVLVDILLRLPPSSRRRARLVCRHWRDVVNEHTTEMRSHPKVLLWNVNYAVAYVSDDLLPSPSVTGSCTEIWRASDPWRHHYEGMELIGTCNGLLCLCDNSLRGGAFTLLNPATAETLAVPRLHCVGHHGWQSRGDSYSFTYHPITGRYKLVHVSGGNDGVDECDAVYVLTLGEATWWKVPVEHGDTTFNHAAGIVSVDGTTYWVKVMAADGIGKIVSFDLMEECVTTSTTPVPVPHDHYRLGEVHGRLGFVAWPNVWVLEEGQRWSHRYNFGTHGIPRPHFMYGEYILTCKGLSYYGHRTKGTHSSGWKLVCENVMRVGHRDEGALVAKMTREGTRCFDGNYATFTYVETTEPLSIYAIK